MLNAPLSLQFVNQAFCFLIPFLLKSRQSDDCNPALVHVYPMRLIPLEVAIDLYECGVFTKKLNVLLYYLQGLDCLGQNLVYLAV